MKVLTVDAYQFIAKCLLIDAPHLRCEADLFGKVEDPKSLIKSLHREINDALDIFQAIVCDPSGTYRKLDGTYSDLISAIHENHEETKDEQDKINMVHTLCVFADELRTEEDDDDLRRLLEKTRYYTKRINDIRRVINDQLTILAFCEEISSSKIVKALNSIAAKVRESAYAGAREATIRNTPKIVTKALKQYDAETVGEAHEDEKPKKTRKPGGGRKRAFDLDRRQVRAVLTLSLQTPLSSARAYCEEIIRRGTDDEGRPFSKPFTDAKKLAATVATYCEERGGAFMADFVRKTPKKANNALGKKYRR